MASSITLFNQIGEYAKTEFKNITDLELNKEYKIERFEKVKTKFGPSILCHLEEYRAFLPKRFTIKLADKIIKDINKNYNLNLIYKGLKYE